MLVYLNNQLIPADDAKISVFDRGFSYGDSLFETIKVLRGHPVFYDEHIARLKQGMEAAGFGATLNPDEIKKQAAALSQKNYIDSGRMRILVTRGTPFGPGGPDPDEHLNPTVLVTMETITPLAPEHYERGVPCITVQTNRGRYAHIKSAGLLASIMARKEARAAGAWEGIFTTGNGRLLEGIYSNVFFLAENLLVTAPENEPILAGVVRQKVIESAPDLGLSVDYHAPKLEELGMGATSAFLTSSLMGACTISEIDGIKMQPDPGAISLIRNRIIAWEEASAGA